MSLLAIGMHDSGMLISINHCHLCTAPNVVADYLQHAECIKEKSTTEVYCGSHYSRLVDMVKGVAPSTQRELCCSHRAFKVRRNYFLEEV